MKKIISTRFQVLQAPESWSKHTTPLKHIVPFSVSAFLTVCLTGLGQIPPNPWGGFYCDDVSIKAQRGLDTLPTIWLFVLLFFPTVLVVSIIYLLYWSYQVIIDRLGNTCESLLLVFFKEDLFYFSLNNFSKIFIFSSFIILLCYS